MWKVQSGFLPCESNSCHCLRHSQLLTVPAGAFTWLNRHHDASAAQQDSSRDVQAGRSRLTQKARQRPGNLGSAPPADAVPCPSRQGESAAGSQQPQQEHSRGESRAFKSTDARWRSDSTYWKGPRPAGNPSSSPQSPSRQPASVPKWAPRAQDPQAPSSQQGARHEHAKGSQAPRLRWQTDTIQSSWICDEIL